MKDYIMHRVIKHTKKHVVSKIFCYTYHSDMVKNTPVNSLHAGFDLFDLILYIPVNNFSVMLGQVFLG